MSNQHEEQVAGVTLHFKHSSFVKPQGHEKFRVDLALDCTVHDEAVWRTVESKFKEGFRVFTGVDFHIEVMNVVREDLEAMKRRFAENERELRIARDRITQLEDELTHYKEPLAAFGAALRGSRRA